MAKKRLSKIAMDNGKSFKEMITLAETKLADSMISGKGKGIWIDNKGQELLNDACDIPEIVPKHYSATVKSRAPNPRFVYAVIDELQIRVPVLVPKKLARRLVETSITVERITDNEGSTYRRVV
tara:strand:- start:4870 stop:5241 length:372 start_codon:yes stop_codon:yes gene_type:complete